MYRLTLKTLIMIGLAATLATVASAQFSSGSTGSDGAYAPTGTGTILFDPAALGLNPAGDNVFNFTTITIPAGLTVKLVANKVRNQSVTWLATGNVSIAGTLDLSGASAPLLDASNPGNVALYGFETQPGPGGYAGGVGAQYGSAAESGLGQGGGPAGTSGATTAACVGGTASSYNIGYNYVNYVGGSGVPVGAVYGIPFLVPLYGGSGGGGGYAASNAVGGNGGAGGGALRIVSSTQISVTGTINVNGGNSYNSASGCLGGPGAGGAIHLIAPTVTGNGALTAYSGQGYANIGGVNSIGYTGFIRFSTTNTTYTGTVNGNAVATALGSSYFFSGPIYNPPANSTLSLPTLSITQINGTAVPAFPAGNPAVPDIQINATTPVTINIAATNIPVGTIVTLRLTSGTSGDAVVTCNALAGTAAASTATCSATFPFSVSLASLRASW